MQFLGLSPGNLCEISRGGRFKEVAKRKPPDVNPVRSNPPFLLSQESKGDALDTKCQGTSNGVNPIIFGPVFSRRLGKSLGINLIPPKTCSLNCIYCQLGPTPKTSLRRYPYVLPEEVTRQLKKFLAPRNPKDFQGLKSLKSHSRFLRARNKSPDYLTLSGAGEPTLNSKLGEIIRQIKRIAKLPVAVITNSTLLTHPEVRRALQAADVVLPSLDAARQKTFLQINRPQPKLKLKNIIQGLKAFRREYRGEIWLEIMLVKNINDSPQELKALKKAIFALKPDRVQLNTVVREPAEKFAQPLNFLELKQVQKFFGKPCQIITGRKDKRKKILKALTQSTHQSSPPAVRVRGN